MPRGSSIPYRPEVDSLRAIAATLVVLVHSRLPFFEGGFVGVDVFFAISGYLIIGIILRQLERGTFSLKGFWEARVRRICPALYVMLAATLLAMYTLHPYEGLGLVKSLRYIQSSALFYPNLFQFVHPDLAAIPIPVPCRTTWTLGVEMQFYLVCPLILIAIVRVWPSGKATRNCLALLACIFVLLAATSQALVPESLAATLFGHAWELLLGGCLAAYRLTPDTQRGKNVCIIAGLALILLPAILYGRFSAPESPESAVLWGALPCVGALLYIAGSDGLNDDCWLCKAIRWRPMIAVGLMSYSLYLWHGPMFVIYKRLGFDIHPSWQSLPSLTILAALTFSASILSYLYIEKPFRRKRT